MGSVTYQNLPDSLRAIERLPVENDTTRPCGKLLVMRATTTEHDAQPMSRAGLRGARRRSGARERVGWRGHWVRVDIGLWGSGGIRWEVYGVGNLRNGLECIFRLVSPSTSEGAWLDGERRLVV